MEFRVVKKQYDGDHVRYQTVMMYKGDEWVCGHEYKSSSSCYKQIEKMKADLIHLEGK